ncbi:MAG: hypothetical protein B7Z83_03365, partial [Thiomonas sp. 20-64-5]
AGVAGGHHAARQRRFDAADALARGASAQAFVYHLKRFQAGQDRIERDLKEIKARLSTLEAGQGSVLQHIGHLASSIASQQVSIDHLSERIDRVEHRLELA